MRHKSISKRLAIQDPKYEALRQQVEQAAVDMEGIRNLYETLALRDLEIVKLREALNVVYQCEYALDKKGNQILVDDHPCLLVTLNEERIINEALSTNFTPDHLNEWLKEQVGEPVAWADGNDIDMESYADLDYRYKVSTQHNKPFDTPLYALK